MGWGRAEWSKAGAGSYPPSIHNLSTEKEEELQIFLVLVRWVCRWVFRGPASGRAVERPGTDSAKPSKPDKEPRVNLSKAKALFAPSPPPVNTSHFYPAQSQVA